MIRVLRVAGVLVLMCLCIWALGTWHSWHTPNPVSSKAMEGATEDNSVQLSFASTHDVWFGKPIFEVTNDSSITLHHVTIFSWADELLPVLYVGQSAPAEWPLASDEIGKGPFNLPPKESIWFVGPSHGTPHFVLNWLADGNQPKCEVIEPNHVK